MRFLLLGLAQFGLPIRMGSLSAAQESGAS